MTKRFTTKHFMAIAVLILCLVTVINAVVVPWPAIVAAIECYDKCEIVKDNAGLWEACMNGCLYYKDW